MKTWLTPLLLSMAPLAACVQLTDFDLGDGSDGGDASSSSTGDTSSSSSSDTSHSDTSVEPTDGDSTDAEDSGPDVPCGNGMIDPEEECDDANQTNGDGCQTDCTVTGGETIWTVEDVELPHANAVVALPDGGFVVGTGGGYGTVGGVFRFDADGQQVWAQTALFENTPIGGVALSPDGDVIVLGTIIIDFDFAMGDLWVGELSVADGSEQWSALPGIPTASEWGNAIAVDPDGALRVAGYTGGGGASFVLLAGLAPDGTLQWWDEPSIGFGYCDASDVVLLPDGSAVFVGVTEYDGPSLWVRRVDAAGQEQWTQGFEGFIGLPASIERRDDGSFVVVGTSGGKGYTTIVLELDANGIEQRRSTWKRDDVEDQRLYNTALAGDGTIYLAGSVDASDGGFYGALDQHGESLWSQVVSHGDSLDGFVYDAAVLADGGVVFVGGVNDSGDTHLWMRKTGA